MDTFVPTTPGRIRLMRDYTSEEEVRQAFAVRGTMDEGPELETPSRRPTVSWSESNLPDSDRFNSSRHQGIRTSPGRRSSGMPSLGYQSKTSGRSVPAQANLEELGKLVFDLEPVDERSFHERSPSTISRTSRTTAPTSASGYTVLDFFSEDVFQVAMHNPATFHQLLKFSRWRLCGENLEFLDKVDRYNSLLNEVADSMFEIHRDYISVDAANQINIPGNLLIKVNRDMKAALTSTLPKLESVFVDAQKDIERLVAMDIYPRFVRHQMTMSAVKALADDRLRYAGLGDCFVLTDPTKADNPIVYASDGFVKVTGYSRTEIIPRNCRFLQCRHTDKSAVGRLREAIVLRQESVELLLNQKKSGEPFWNLLYTTPLFDDRGNLVFFLGGQVNCSTTIHNASDVLKILAMSDEPDKDQASSCGTSLDPIKPPSRASRFFSSFKAKSSPVQSYPQPGMEERVLRRMDGMQLKRQMDTFYTAYSKFLVVNYSTFFISFHSAGIASLLYAHRSTSTSATTLTSPTSSATQIVGTDVFRFLSAHSPTKLSSDFKSRVRNALRLGSPISLDLTLCTRRYMGHEKYAVHWTPLKNEVGDVGFVVCTMGSLRD
ncbi:hypothetical protein HRR83_000296 [Exophiala dermatitidis]|uniref:Non-specific serine/threonine protein kinase n=2 Tax=Exophiala dermatitidis TaxID=5970 RepID=H6C8W2_EXODN|nr:non-specific serine/threonine protein kinase [Exophiala dermatitidis NIH/UT8656]KAJ4523649.1 hypothetical protein HRR73_002832 [Exophiala dermatitidis]EHY60539.1 non-specific serine/threonine protein kinase [Exophiala dermatitidis NIH/UT8656]KAJ4524672.1 hypothetical protein HRR75_000262 [Exophiala dermatitidis]KAJ4527544.1 hypothetical protein HRR74_000298 [Exophiala dermatitidis]KAJ4531117.1 hypothetical protein HRR76_008794 [Exophiala dermatitidis]